jgi:antitoxin YefM
MIVPGARRPAISDRVSYSELRRRLKAACDQVCDRHEPLVVERRRGGDVVLVAKEDFDSLEETAYLLSSPENARRLLQALARRAEDRQAFESIDELKNALGV